MHAIMAFWCLIAYNECINILYAKYRKNDAFRRAHTKHDYADVTLRGEAKQWSQMEKFVNRNRTWTWTRNGGTPLTNS